MCIQRVDVIVINLQSITIDKVLIMEFMTAKISKNLNSMKKTLTQ